mmetsp:Transcript_33893/g.71871  ORF Transcript_33893/g.71871 Transcript_33893/m.71871 type:complete len:86 (-) Transcript_33893:130-387(-)
MERTTNLHIVFIEEANRFGMGIRIFTISTRNRPDFRVKNTPTIPAVSRITKARDGIDIKGIGKEYHIIIFPISTLKRPDPRSTAV